jgi:uncharacterized protein with von Willebrand factor type A (vWA) domain
VSERTALADRIDALALELRSRGVPVATTERIDALAAAAATPLHRPGALYAALSATLIKSPDHIDVFDQLFQLYFAAPCGAQDGATIASARTGLSESPSQAITLDLDQGIRAVLRADRPLLAQMIAEEAVTRFARFEPGLPVAGVQYADRTVVGLGLAQAVREVREVRDELPGAPANAPERLRLTLSRQQVDDRAEDVQARIQSVIRTLMVADRGARSVAETLRTPLPLDVPLAMATRAQLLDIEAVLRPLEQKLAGALMRRRRRAGPVDVRATIRSSMTTGGVPFTVIHRKAAAMKPTLFVLADMSGSVATFGAFTITLMHSLRRLHSRLRTFAFVENAVEVSELLTRSAAPSAAIDSLNTLEGLYFYDGHTDYGRALGQFEDQIGPQLDHRSIVLIFGDARSNYRVSGESRLASLARRSGSLFWLNPEPRSLWGSGDSIMDRYAPYCTRAVPCRTLDDLRRFIEEMP